jgi:hypothetical protein
LSGHLVGTECALCAIKGFAGELLDVRLTGSVINDGIVVSALRLCGFKAIDERLGVGEGLVVCIV